MVYNQAATTASISAINSGLNGDNLGDILEDSFQSVASEDGMKSIATSMAIGGLAGLAGDGIVEMKKSYIERKIKTNPEITQTISTDYPNFRTGNSYGDNIVPNTGFENNNNWLVGDHGKVLPKLHDNVGGVRSASEFHDAFVGTYKLDTGILKYTANPATIPPAFALNYCTASPQLCAMFPDLFINVGTGGQIKTDLNIYKQDNLYD